MAEKECEKIRSSTDPKNFGGLVAVHDEEFNTWLLEKLTRGYNPSYYYKFVLIFKLY